MAFRRIQRPGGRPHCATVPAFLLAAAICFGASPARAIELTTGDGYPPYVDEKLPQGGLATDIVREAYKAVGIAATVRHLPWKRGYDATLRGEFTATFPYLRNAERERDFLISAPLYPVRLMIFYAGPSGFAYTGLDSLKGKTTCIEFGGIPQRSVRSLIEAGDVTLVETKDMLSCARMMGAGHVDFFIVNEQVGKTAVADADLPAGTIRMVEQPFALMSQYLLVPRIAPDAAKEVETFNRGLAKLKASGSYDTILDRHLGGS